MRWCLFHSIFFFPLSRSMPKVTVLIATLPSFNRSKKIDKNLFSIEKLRKLFSSSRFFLPLPSPLIEHKMNERRNRRPTEELLFRRLWWKLIVRRMAPLDQNELCVCVRVIEREREREREWIWLWSKLKKKAKTKNSCTDLVVAFGYRFRILFVCWVCFSSSPSFRLDRKRRRDQCSAVRSTQEKNFNFLLLVLFIKVHSLHAVTHAHKQWSTKNGVRNEQKGGKKKSRQKVKTARRVGEFH